MLLALWIEQVAAVEGPFSADRDVVGILDVNEGQRPNAVGGKVGVDRAAAGIVAVEVGTGVERLVGLEILNAFERGSFFQFPGAASRCSEGRCFRWRMCRPGRLPSRLRACGIR